jgi:methyl-accepting chemotaxis protein
MAGLFNRSQDEQEQTVGTEDVTVAEPSPAAQHDMLNRLFARFTIKQRVWGSMALMLVFLIAVAGISLINLLGLQKTVHVVVEENQPVAMTSMRLNSELRRAVGALGFFLLSKGDAQKAVYESSLIAVDNSVTALKKIAAADKTTFKRVEAIEDKVAQFKEYKPRMLELAKDQNKNMPGMAFAAQEMASLAQAMRGHLATIVLVETDEVASETRKQLLIDVAALRYQWANIMNGVRAYLGFRVQSILDEVKGPLKEEADRLIKKIQGYGGLLTLEQEIAMGDFVTMYNSYYKKLDELNKIHGSDKWRTDAYLISHEVGELLQDIEADLNALIDDAGRNIKDSSGALLNEVDGAMQWVGWLSVVGLFIGIAGAWVGVRLISRPLEVAHAAMADIAEGEGDLTRRLDASGRDEISQLAGAFNVFVEKIQAMVGHVAQSTNQLASTAEQMSIVTEETREGMHRQRAETDQVATAMNQMTATVQEVARNASSAAASAHHADEQATQGKQVMGQSMKANDLLAKEVERAAEVIERLEGESESIGKVLEVIQEIAEQTNLLALNAAIEAARAGEQGRGFAVVADEVRTLANRTQHSTQEIQQIIERLQTGATEAAQVMVEGKSRAQESVELVDKAGEALDVIVGAVDTISTMNTQIASAAEEQTAVAEEINRNIVNITQVAEGTSNGAQQTSAASEQLARLASELQTLVGRFRV